MIGPLSFWPSCPAGVKSQGFSIKRQQIFSLHATVSFVVVVVLPCFGYLDDLDRRERQGLDGRIGPQFEVCHLIRGDFFHVPQDGAVIVQMKQPAVTAASLLCLWPAVEVGLLVGWVGAGRGAACAMRVGGGMFAGVMVLVGISPIYVALFIAILATGLSKIVLDPAQYAYLGDRVAFERRGTAMALVELSWSLAFLVGIPLVGLMIAA